MGAMVNQPRLDQGILRFLYWSLMVCAGLLWLATLAETGVRIASLWRSIDNQHFQVNRNSGREFENWLTSVQIFNFLLYGTIWALFTLAVGQAVGWLDRERAWAEESEPR
jgi:hypothetical protein